MGIPEEAIQLHSLAQSFRMKERRTKSDAHRRSSKKWRRMSEVAVGSIATDSELASE